MSEEKEKAMKKAMSLLSRRAHGRSELAGKLKLRGFSGQTIKAVLDDCERLNFINDRDFAELYIEELKGRGFGSRRIKNELNKKRLPRPVIEELMEESPEDKENEYSRAEVVLERKMKSLARESDPRKRREKIYRFMASRGFSGDIISQLLEKIK